ncbi:AAA family ATPase, partial [Oceanospirillum sp. HFRX-1_2]
LLPFYKAYRAMVRAKVTRFMLLDPSIDEAGRVALEADYQRYIDLAESYTVFEQPFMLITHGVSGSGKSSISRAVIKELGVIRIRSDVERKRLFGLSAEQSSHSELNTGIYTPEATQQTYEKLTELADYVIHSATPVIIDATNLKRWQRDSLRDQAEQLGVPALTLSFTACQETLERRVKKRHAAGNDASEADLAVLHKQLADQEAIAPEEADYTIIVNTDEDDASTKLLLSIRRQFGLQH